MSSRFPDSSMAGDRLAKQVIARGFSQIDLPTAAQEAARDGVWRRSHATRYFGEGHVRAQLKARRWAAPLPRITVTHNGVLTQRQKYWVALMAAPPGAVLTGLTAAELDGFRGFPAKSIQLLIPGSSYPPATGLGLPRDWNVQLRWSKLFDGVDIRDSAIPPRTRRARSIVVAATDRVPQRRARVLILAAVQQGFVRCTDLDSVVRRLGRCRNRQILLESVRDAAGGIESLPEWEFETIRRRLRLPEPSRQRVMLRLDGRYYLDVDWPDFGIQVEIHGIPHLEIVNWDADLLRQNDLNIEGGHLLVYSSYAIRHRLAKVESQLVDTFVRRGWSR